MQHIDSENLHYFINEGNIKKIFKKWQFGLKKTNWSKGKGYFVSLSNG
jgi:hypothetical protein